MKHQYFGDVNDYLKYGLLRGLSADSRLRIGVCWMLTEGDRRSDGQKVAYLSKPDNWHHHDPELFTFLHEAVHRKKRRNVKLIQSSGLIPGARFYSELLADRIPDREDYFARMLMSFADRDLIFFDPDNGIEVQSVPLGRRNSSKYLYMHEIQTAYANGKSVLIFQHFAREQRDRSISRRVAQIREVTGSNTVLCFRTSSVAYFLAAQRTHANLCRAQGREIARKWADKIMFVSKQRQPCSPNLLDSDSTAR